MTEDVLTYDIANSIIGSVRWWPENYGLQIDVMNIELSKLYFSETDVSMPNNNHFKIFFTLVSDKGGDYAGFPEWFRDIADILEFHLDFYPCTMAYYRGCLNAVKPKQTYEIVPYYEVAHLDPNDFLERLVRENEAKKSTVTNTNEDPEVEVFDSVNGLLTHIGDKLRQSHSKNYPSPQPSNAKQFFQKIYDSPGVHFRTIIAPTPDRVANQERKTAYDLVPEIDFDLNIPVVYMRTTLSSNTYVPYDLKRLFVDFARDCDIIELTSSDVQNLTNNPLKAIRKSPRLAVTAISFMRLPMLSGTSEYFENLRYERADNMNFELSPEMDLLRRIVQEETGKLYKEHTASQMDYLVKESGKTLNGMLDSWYKDNVEHLRDEIKTSVISSLLSELK